MDSSQLKIVCPQRVRWTASRVSGNVPYFREQVSYDGNGQARAAAGLYEPESTAQPVLLEEETGPAGLETVEEQPDLCLAEEQDTKVNDPTIRIRSMS